MNSSQVSMAGDRPDMDARSRPPARRRLRQSQPMLPKRRHIQRGAQTLPARSSGMPHLPRDRDGKLNVRFSGGLGDL